MRSNRRLASFGIAAVCTVALACSSPGGGDGPDRDAGRQVRETGVADDVALDEDGRDEVDTGTAADVANDTLDDAATDAADDPTDDTDADPNDETDTGTDDAGGSDSGSDTRDDAGICATASSTTAPSARPADIVWVVDNSLSMQEEVVAVSEGLNAFASFIGDSGIDYQVVMIAWDDPVVGDGWYHVCVPPPLSATAAGVCPEGRDVDGERYLHVRVTVDSTEPLQRVVGEHGAYASRLRPDATTHIIAVTDDDSALAAESFLSQLDGLSPRLAAPVVVHSVVTTRAEDIADPFDDSCERPGCPCGYAVGRTYMQLGDMTGGTVSSICEPDWTPIFDAIAASVVETSAVPCSYVIPELDGPVGVDPERVNVYAIDGERRELVPNVDSADACGDTPGWYYDDPDDPRRVELCSAACVDVEGEVEIEFGCDTVKR